MTSHKSASDTNELVFLDPDGPRQLEAEEEAPSMLAAEWQARFEARLDEVERMRRLHPVASQQPDATALITSLQSGPDAMIRQLPQAARETLHLLDDPGASRAKITEKLGGDPALVQSLLMTANSAIFSAGRGEVLSIGQALDRIGVEGARSVVLASSIQGLLSKPGGVYGTMAAKVWDHMVRMAPIARALAPAFRADPEETFAVAVLHDVGKLVIFDRLSVLRQQHRRQMEIDTAFLSIMLQQVHESLGALSATRWGIGAKGATAIGTHHRVGESRSRPDAIAEAVFLAERLDHATRRGEAPDFDRWWKEGWLRETPAIVAGRLPDLLVAV
jgi:HD-like signal output (HDOD) protein